MPQCPAAPHCHPEPQCHVELAETLDISVKKVDKQMQAVLKELKLALSDYLDVFLLLSVANMMKIQ